MMARQRWRGRWDRGATATAAPEDTACAGDNGLRTADPGPGGTLAGPDPGLAGQHAPAAGLPAGPGARPRVPGWLERAAGWAWRLLVLGALLYVLIRVIGMLRVVVLPCVASLLLTALLQPLNQRLRRFGLPALAATWSTMLAAFAVLAGVATLAATQTSADYQRLVTDVGYTTNELQRWLA